MRGLERITYGKFSKISLVLKGNSKIPGLAGACGVLRGEPGELGLRPRSWPLRRLQTYGCNRLCAFMLLRAASHMLHCHALCLVGLEKTPQCREDV